MPARDYTLWNPPCKSLPNTISISQLSWQDQPLCFDLKKGIQKNLKIKPWYYFVVQTDSHDNRGIILPLITVVRWKEPIINIFPRHFSFKENSDGRLCQSRVPFSPISIGSLEPNHDLKSFVDLFCVSKASYIEPSIKQRKSCRHHHRCPSVRPDKVCYSLIFLFPVIFPYIQERCSEEGRQDKQIEREAAAISYHNNITNSS